jgi:hypothetical protein
MVRFNPAAGLAGLTNGDDSAGSPPPQDAGKEVANNDIEMAPSQI